MAFSEPPRKMVETALLLVGRVHHGDAEKSAAAQSELEKWRTGSPECRAALQTAQRLWASTDASFLQSDIPVPQRQSAARTRRNALGVLGVGGLAALLWGGGRWYWQQPVYELALQTEHAQQREMRLPDGSEVSLAPHTRTLIVLYRDRREVQLMQGEMRFHVARDTDRPFTVATQWGLVRVLGTTFSVSTRHGQMRVEVAEGQVAVLRGDGAGASTGVTPDAAVTLTAGQAVEANGQGLGPRKEISADNVGAWRSGWMVFNDTPLDQVLAQWNDYLQQPLRLGSHPRLKHLRLSGSFPLRQPQAFLTGLPDMLPVRVLRNAAGEMQVELR